MTQEEVKAKVRAVLALMKPEWKWAFFNYSGWCCVTGNTEPIYRFGDWVYPFMGGENFCTIGSLFDLPHYPGDWAESLVER